MSGFLKIAGNLSDWNVYRKFWNFRAGYENYCFLLGFIRHTSGSCVASHLSIVG